MAIQPIVYIPTMISTAILGLVVYLNNKKATINRMFAFFSLAIVAWLILLFIADTSTSAVVSTVFLRLGIATSIVMATSFILLADVLSTRGQRTEVLWMVSVLPIIFFVPLSFTNYVVKGVALKPWGADVISGPIYNYVTAFFFACMIVGGALMLHRMKSRTLAERQQSKLILIGVSLTFLVNAITNAVLVGFGISQYGVVLGVPSILFIVGFTSYAIIKHKLFDIRLIVARSVTYILSMVTIGVAYGFMAFSLVDKWFFASKGTTSFSQQSINTLLAIGLAFTFQPIRRFFEKVTDKIFYRDKYDAQLLINNVGRILASEIQLEALTTKVVHEIKKQVRVEHADIVVLEDNQDSIYFDAGHLETRTKLSRRDLIKLGYSVVVADDLSSGERKHIMQTYGMSVAAALRSNGELIGYLFLGNKKSGDIYTAADIEVIKIIVNELAVAVQNAKAYTEIQRFNETLQEKVADATRKLRQANEDLKSLDRAKDEFISMASHQLRTPLTTAKGYVSMVLEGDFGKVSSKIQTPLEQALDSSNRMSGLINDLLNVSRMDAGKFFIDATDVDLDVEVRGEVNQLANLAQTKNVTITYHPPKKKIPLIKLDLDKTRQVIMNLADNAVHYSAPPSGGGKVDVYLELEGDQAVFKVVDNGIGVPDNIKSKLFTKFFRASNAQSARPDGTGLGLYLVKRVVEDQGGEITFESQVGKGSTFGFRMPLHNKLKVDKEAIKRLGR